MLSQLHTAPACSSLQTGCGSAYATPLESAHATAADCPHSCGLPDPVAPPGGHCHWFRSAEPGPARAKNKASAKRSTRGL
eukprot:g17749.t1